MIAKGQVPRVLAVAYLRLFPGAGAHNGVEVVDIWVPDSDREQHVPGCEIPNVSCQIEEVAVVVEGRPYPRKQDAGEQHYEIPQTLRLGGTPD